MSRLHPLDDRPLRPDGAFVLYWMIAARRTRYNPAMEYAAALARELGRPLVVLEGLDLGAPWASDRTHRFVLDGMRENAAAIEAAGAVAYPYLETARGDGRGLVEALASDACVVVTDLYPGPHALRVTRSVAARAQARMVAVDGNGLLPLAEGAAHATAAAFRRSLQARLPGHLARLPVETPLTALPAPPPNVRAGLAALQRRWPMLATLPDLAELPLDHEVSPTALTGGPAAASAALRSFVDSRLDTYAEGRNDPADDSSSGLSPYLHFGHLSAHEVFAAVVAHERWTIDRLAPRVHGRRVGWWGMQPGAEALLDQVVTWRELGYQFCHHAPDYASYGSLPAWARATLDAHRDDPRPEWYTFDRLQDADTPDPVWNAAQRQLRAEGRIHNYLRMLWGKKVLEWAPSPEAALDALIELNNRWALDGRDPNSYSGIAWTLGRFDRPWGPVRPVFGTVRYMSSANTLRKLDMGDYLQRYGAHGR